MAALADRVKETTTTTGTGNITLAGAASGYQSFNSAFGVGLRFVYAIESGTDWEQGIGRLSGSTTLVRETVEYSSNSNAAISLTGTSTVFCSPGPATIRPAGLGHRLAGFPTLN